jgi:hypothetical protein
VKRLHMLQCISDLQYFTVYLIFVSHINSIDILCIGTVQYLDRYSYWGFYTMGGAGVCTVRDCAYVLYVSIM